MVFFLFLAGVGCKKENTDLVPKFSAEATKAENLAESAGVESKESQPISTSTPILTPDLFHEPVQVVSTPPKIFDHSVLTFSQRERLYRTSLTFLADTEDEAIQVAQGLNYVEKFGHPATFCGPLSIGILQKAGLVDRTVSIHDFWLLNPRDDYTVSSIIEKTFPPEDYLWFRTKTPLNKFDFNEFPLYSGDFIYIFAGPRGTFEHMLTVTRVDEMGRVYAVTAETYTGEYAISELMLYDPKNPGVGFFYDLTNIDNMYTMGVTGFDGFQLWRPLRPIPDLPPEALEFQNSLDAMIDDVGGEWYVQVKEVGGKILYSYQEDEDIHPGSVIKVPLAMLYFEALPLMDPPSLTAFLDENGVAGRTYTQLLEAMLVDSEEDATELLYDFTKDRININGTLADWGYRNTSLSPRKTTVREISNVFEDLWLNTNLTGVESQIIKGYLGVYTSGDDSRIGIIRQGLPESVRFFSKRGSLVEERVIVAEVAVLESDDRAYIIGLFAYPERGKTNPTYDDLESAIETVSWFIWDYIQNLE